MTDFKDKQPFYSTRTEEERAEDKRKVYTVSLNPEEQEWLRQDMLTLQQSKEGTALKTLWKVGRSVLHDKKTGQILRAVLGNLRKNERIGIADVSAEIPSSSANVTQKNEEK